MKTRVGVIFGGETVEHEISVISAVQAMEYMDQNKYEIIPIYIAKDRTWYTGKMLMDIDVYQDFEQLKKYATPVTLYRQNGRFLLQKTKGLLRKVVAELDIAFPIVHGNNTEDGSLAGYLQSLDIPFFGPRVLGAALGQDKIVMKQVMAQEGIPTPEYVWFYESEYLEKRNEWNDKIEKLGYPIIVKPATLGSSVGITLVKEKQKIEQAILDAFRYDEKVIVEKVIENLVEVNCSVLGNFEHQETSAIDEMLTKNDFLTYDDKYLGEGKKGKGMYSRGMKGQRTAKGKGSIDRIIPARINKEMEQEVKELAIRTFKALNLSGIVRIDFLIDKDTNTIYVNEPNTIPGSLSFYLWEAAGKSYSALLDDAIKLTIKEYKRRSKKVYSFDTNVLNNFHSGLKGAKGLKRKKM